MKQSIEKSASEVHIPSGQAVLECDMHIPAGATGIVLFAHGSGSGRHSPRNQFVAGVIRDAGAGTLLFDLLTHDEEQVDIHTRYLRFDMDLLANRLIDATNWIRTNPDARHLRIGYFGSSTGAGAALVAAAQLGPTIGAVVSRGGRPDLAAAALRRVSAPTLLVVGGYDEAVIALNEEAYSNLQCTRELKVVPRATHLFEEPGALEQVAEYAAAWFARHLNRARPQDVTETVEIRRAARK
jgi:dienelactone hydrolase